MPDYMTPDEVDELLKWPRGKAKRLGKRGKLPGAIILPDGSVRFRADTLKEYLDAAAPAAPRGTGGRP